MAWFAVRPDDDSDAMLYMEADDKDSYPSRIEPGEVNIGLQDYAYELATEMGATVGAIASRMGHTPVLQRADGHTPGDEARDVPPANVRPPLGRRRDVVGKNERQADDTDDVDLSASGEIVKTDPEQRLVFGWAYVTHDTEGNVVVDKSGDFIDDYNEIEKSAYDFVLKSRQGDAMHTGVKTSDIVESVVFTPEKIAKMGIPPGTVPTGWWVGFKVADDETWSRVKKGELVSFSVHGKGTRKSVSGE